MARLTVFVEWDFVQGLQFSQQIPEDADFVRLVYTIRLKKVWAFSRLAESVVQGFV